VPPVYGGELVDISHYYAITASYAVITSGGRRTVAYATYDIDLAPGVAGHPVAETTLDGHARFICRTR